MAHPAGLFIWVDVAVPDPEAAADFYKSVLGWDAASVSPDPDMGYWNFTLGGKVAAGMGKLSEEQVARGIPPMWSSYIKVDDCEATAAKAAELGGTVMMPPMQIFTSGKMAYLMDPTGAAFAIWESGDFDGSDEFNSPGFFSWNELATRDTAAALEFYTALFGWESESMPMGEGGAVYTMFKVGDRNNGGMYDAAMLPSEVPAHWGVYFTVEDVDAAAAAVKANGGMVMQEPFDMMVGRMAVVADSQGALFNVFSGPTD
ncbi:VOC family protein [bacterium]|nr:VOC family protein [bacterium]